MLDDRQITQSSQQEDLPVWSANSNEFGWRSYLVNSMAARMSRRTPLPLAPRTWLDCRPH
jgi:hypothetical protein